MQSMRVAVFLFSLAILSACTSADVALRKPQSPHADGNDVATPIPTVRQLPATTRHTVPAVPRAAVPQSNGTQGLAPQSPVPVTSCDPGGCWGTDNRYQGGAGNIYLDRNGRLCQGNGTWMQCF